MVGETAVVLIGDAATRTVRAYRREGFDFAAAAGGLGEVVAEGRTWRVEVIADGSFEWDGRRWRSLSAIAREITGARWSGPRFFGIRQALKPFSSAGTEANDEQG